MGRETLEIVAFNTGLITGASAEEIPDDAAADGSENLDHEAPEGILRGRTIDTNIVYDSGESVAGDLIIGNTIENSDGTVDLFYIESGTTTPKRAPGYPNGGVPSSTGFTAVSGVVSMIPTAMTMRIGATAPSWLGNLAYHHDWDSTDYGWTNEAAALVATGIVPASTIAFSDPLGDAGGLVNNRTYVYRFAYIYDGFQIGPMNSNAISVPLEPATFTKNKLGIQPTVTIASVPKRATHLAIFRAENVGPRTTDSQGITSAFNYVGKVSFVTDSWTVTADPLVYMLATAFEDVGQSSGTYEELTGIPETLSDPSVAYNYGAVANSRFCAIQCTRSEYSDASFMLFVSRPLNYDTFNYLDDFVRLPFYPVAVMGFRNRCFVFGKTRMAVVNLETMSIEEDIEGIGCKGQAAVFATEFGLFWIDDNGAYMHDGQQAQQIGAAILPSLKTWLLSGTFTTQFHAKWKSILFLKHGTTSVTCYAFNLVRKRWDYLVITDIVGAGMVSVSPVSIRGAAGTVFIIFKSTGSSNQALNVGSQTSHWPAWIWISKKFHMGLPSQYKFINDISTRSTIPTPTVEWSLDGGAYATTITQDTAAKTVQVKITGDATSEGSNIESLAIRYRMPVGRR